MTVTFAVPFGTRLRLDLDLHPDGERGKGIRMSPLAAIENDLASLNHRP
jgi:hypothetical protein